MRGEFTAGSAAPAIASRTRGNHASAPPAFANDVHSQLNFTQGSENFAAALAEEVQQIVRGPQRETKFIAAVTTQVSFDS